MRKYLICAVFSILAVSASCHLYNLERRLGAEDADFLSKVRYIISKQERKIFLELPDSEKVGFKEEFWKRRDPDPDTEENEFKTQYFDRIERADDLFHGEGRPGWQTDRGRIYVLFGPPSERSTYPMQSEGECREIWYYGSFPVIFLDAHCSGNYQLTPINLEHLQELNKAQEYYQDTINPESKPKKFFDYEVVLRKVRADEASFEGTIFIDVPYSGVWFKAREGRLEAEFDVRAELKDARGGRLWEFAKVFPLSIKEDEIIKYQDKKYRMEIPLSLSGVLDTVRRERCTLHIKVKNSTEGEELKKVVDFPAKILGSR